MFNINAYCFCPEFIGEKIRDTAYFYGTLVPSTVSKNHHLLIDKNEELWLAYLEQFEGDPNAYLLFNHWQTLLKGQANKILLSNTVIEGSIESKDIADITINTPATAHRYIVTDDNNSFKDEIARLQEHGIRLLHHGILNEASEFTPTRKSYTHSGLYQDILKALSFVALSRADRRENEHNDHLRDLLGMCNYDIYDQTRAGTSSTRISIGNLDLAVKFHGRWVSIIEPLRLNSVDTSNIVLHYNKLINNYNPLGIMHTHLIVYYTGQNINFADFFVRYQQRIQSLDPTQFDGEVTFGELTPKESDYANLKSFVQTGSINGNPFQCFHTCISFE
ncbi:hypothetical protein SKP08_001979 [Vibrio fluvialis]|nr:hypothetical protein [Vibrio fluvialis]